MEAFSRIACEELGEGGFLRMSCLSAGLFPLPVVKEWASGQFHLYPPNCVIQTLASEMETQGFVEWGLISA